jgi:hypothetical protein
MIGRPEVRVDRNTQRLRRLACFARCGAAPADRWSRAARRPLIDRRIAALGRSIPA